MENNSDWYRYAEFKEYESAHKAFKHKVLIEAKRGLSIKTFMLIVTHYHIQPWNL